MATSLLTDAYGFEFTPDGYDKLELTGFNSGWTDKVPIRHAAHEYIKRDGGEIEHLGAGIREFAFPCFFTGPSWRKKYTGLVQAILLQPFGLLSHPLFGKIRAFCTGIDAATVNLGQALDTVIFTLGFKEDAVDTAGSAATIVSISFQGQKVQALGQSFALASAAPRYLAFPQVPATVQQAVTLATSYATAAVLSANTNTPDLTLSVQLAAIQSACKASLLALRATGIPDPLLYGDLATCYGVYASALTLDELLVLRQPEIELYTVRARTSVAALCAKLYGPDALSRMPELLTNNAGRWRGPGIPTGTRLTIRKPTVPQ